MRYQELREGRSHLENAIKYLKGLDPIPVLPLVILYDALAFVRAEQRHPERFNTDGTPRLARLYDSSNGAARGTPQPADTKVDGVSRQVRRWLARTLGFGQMSFPRVTQVNGTDEKPTMQTLTGRAPMMSRSERRRITRKARIDKPQGETSNENSGRSK